MSKPPNPVQGYCFIMVLTETKKGIIPFVDEEGITSEEVNVIGTIKQYYNGEKSNQKQSIVVKCHQLIQHCYSTIREVTSANV